MREGRRESHLGGGEGCGRGGEVTEREGSQMGA